MLEQFHLPATVRVRESRSEQNNPVEMFQLGLDIGQLAGDYTALVFGNWMKESEWTKDWESH